MRDDKENLARLVELEEERAKREKADEFSKTCFTLAKLIFLGLFIYFAWQFCTGFNA